MNRLHSGAGILPATGDWPFTGACVPDGQSAFRKAAERRQTVAHGASRGDDVRTKHAPRQGRQSWRIAPCAKFSVAPPGLACGAPGNPRLTPWATFSRRSAPPEYASAVRRASILYSQNGQSPVAGRSPATHAPGRRRQFVSPVSYLDFVVAWARSQTKSGLVAGTPMNSHFLAWFPTCCVRRTSSLRQR